MGSLFIESPSVLSVPPIDESISVEVDEELFSDAMRRLEETRRDLQRKLESVLGVRVKLTLVEPGGLERFTGKAQRVVDQRAF